MASPKTQEPFEASYQALALGLLSDRGGAGAVTTAELCLIETTAQAYVVARKLARRMFIKGVTRKNGDLTPAMACYFTAVNTLRLNLTSLGLDRRAKSVDSYIAAAHRRVAASRDVDEDSELQTTTSEAAGATTSGEGAPEGQVATEDATATDDAAEIEE